MSSKKKNQHFVPRHYLRRFCFDDGKQIRIFKVANGDYVPQAGLKGQCDRPYFYHTDPGVEDTLSNLEGRAEELFKKMVGEYRLPTDIPTKHDILTVLNVMRSRTEMFSNQTLKFVETSALESLRIDLEANNKHELLKFLPAMVVSVANWPTQGLFRGLTSAMLIGDLHLKLLIPPPRVHLMTSDHPVVPGIEAKSVRPRRAMSTWASPFTPKRSPRRCVL